MLDVIVDCHKCKYEFNGECVPRSQKMKFPNCYKRTQTNADKIKQAGNESEVASAFVDFLCSVPCIGGKCKTPDKTCHQCALDWLKQEVTDK